MLPLSLFEFWASWFTNAPFKRASKYHVTDNVLILMDSWHMLTVHCLMASSMNIIALIYFYLILTLNPSIWMSNSTTISRYCATKILHRKSFLLWCLSAFFFTDVVTFVMLQKSTYLLIVQSKKKKKIRRMCWRYLQYLKYSAICISNLVVRTILQCIQILCEKSKHFSHQRIYWNS